MIPLRDANPTRRTPVVTLGIIIACFVVFAWELGLSASGGQAALDARLDVTRRRAPGDPGRRSRRRAGGRPQHLAGPVGVSSRSAAVRRALTRADP
jgi:membrane associated rhomboid family serine protease